MTANNSEQSTPFYKIEHTKISLPRGGGAIRGSGEKFQANPVTGSGSFSLPVPVSPGRSGFQPELSLGYDSGSGNGPFGLGWSCAAPAITRKTDKELPRYLDDPKFESDTFILAGAEDLVPEMNAAGTERLSYEITETEDGTTYAYTVHRYRPRIEGLFAKIEKWTENDSGEAHWRITTKENITSIYGKNAEARIADPERSERVFQWLIEKSFDSRDNIIQYEYKAEDRENVVLTESELHRGDSSFTNRYLKRILYSPFAGDDERFHFQVLFDYGEHGEDSPGETATWPCRLDPFSSRRAGFEIRHYRLCRRIMMFHNFTTETTNNWVPVKSLELTYNESESMTFLASARIRGYRRSGTIYDTKTTPAIEFTYSEAVPGTEIKFMDRESLRNLPAGLDEASYQWADLKGEGNPGIVIRQGEGIFFKENLGGGRLGPMTPVFSPSALSPERPVQLSDIDGDGVQELVIHDNNLHGYYRYSDEGWEPFRAFEKNPSIDWSDPNLKMIDLNGDGHADIVISELQAFMVFHSAEKEGFEAPVRIPSALRESEGPRVVFADPEQSIYLADMTGDGLTDIVRIRNGSVCYWPNRGHGSFGARVSMEKAPRFTEKDLRFNQHYVKLGDIDGSGTTDIIYLGSGRPRIYFNRAGNSWSEGLTLESFMPVDSLSSVSMTDLLGKGTMCLVWSTQRPGMGDFQMCYVDLMTVKPNLLTEINDNMGSVISLSYAPSTKFFLEDREEGSPWITKLPFPVHCLERVETRDEIGGSTLVTTYRYHHGYFDGTEREFRGFGMVESLDTETATGEETDEHYTAPILTKTWYHTGAFVEDSGISKQYESEYFQGDADAFYLPDSILEDSQSMDAHELRQAYRALKGSALRQEIYEYGVDTPYQVKEAGFITRMVQGTSDYSGKGVFFTHAREALTFHYEKEAGDPRVAHEFILEVDDFGNVLQKAEAVYPRRSVSPTDYANTAMGEVHTEQQEGHATLTVSAFINETDDFYLPGLQYSQASYELGNISFHADTAISFSDMTGYASTALSNIIMPESDFSGSTAQARLVTESLRCFWNDTQSAALAAGETTALALEHHIETTALTTGLVTAAYGTDVTAAMLTAAGYTLRDGIYYNPGMTRIYATGSFHLPTGTEDPLGGYVLLTYDDYTLLPVQTQDALGNTTTALMDYTVMSPKRITDANGNVSEAVYDALGMVTATSLYGHEGSASKGDTVLYDSAGTIQWNDPFDADQGSSFADIVTNPADYLQEAATYFYYDLEAWADRGEPPCFAQLERETHVSDLGTGESTAIRITLGYSDGFERELQTKVLEGAGTAWVPSTDPGTGDTIFTEAYADTRWLVSGRTIYNNKGKAVRRYEPFYSATHEFEDEAFFNSYGVSSTLHYDPLMRVVRTDTPKGFFSKVEFTPWYVMTFDENDTVTDSEYYAAYSSLSDKEQDALDKAAAHYNTPSAAVLDSLGREFMQCKYLTDISEITSENRENIELMTYTEFTITGKPKTIRDPRITALTTLPPLPPGEGGTIPNFLYTYDMTDEIIRTVHMDGGDDRVFRNVPGSTTATWDARGSLFTIEYDLLQRPLSKHVTNSGLGLDNTVEYLTYGEGVTNAALYNLRGQLYRHYDQAGMVLIPEYTFKGEVKTTETRIRSAYKTEADWPEAIADRNALLQTDTFDTTTDYDALGRVREQENADNSVSAYEYHPSGPLQSVGTTLKNESSAVTQVSDITYNARGQRERITYGNGTYTDYTYEATTFRLQTLTTTRSSDSATLQEISYTYDPAGNLTEIYDNSIDTVFSNNQQVEPRQRFTYDALYRLTEAEGREHTGLNNPDYYKDTEAFKQSAFISISDANDDNRLANYTRRYTYDRAGNMLTVQHIAADSARSFTRTIRVDENSNRWLPENMGTGLTISDYYDQNGNITSLETLVDVTWNYRDNIASAVLLQRTNNIDNAEYYVYDASGQRRRKVRETLISATWGTYEVEEKIYLGPVEIKRIRTVYGGTSVYTLRRSTLHVMDDTRRIATVHYWSLDTNLREINSSLNLNINKTRYQYANHLDSASLELNYLGAIISYEEYFPYGDTSLIAGTAQKEVKLKEYRYTGKEKDDATGLYYFGARYYASWLGRWLSADPLFRNNPAVYDRPRGGDKEERQQEEQEFWGKVYSEGVNLYEYVTGNPVRLVDAEGREIVEPDKDNKETSWNIQKGETLSEIAENINKEYNMDVTVDDILKANKENKAVIDKDNIVAGGKLNLSFLKIEKSFTIGGGDLEASSYIVVGAGGSIIGYADIVENKTIIYYK